MARTWAIVEFKRGRRELWGEVDDWPEGLNCGNRPGRDYGEVAWGSSLYLVLGYVQGSYRDARRFLAQLPTGTPEWEDTIAL